MEDIPPMKRTKLSIDNLQELSKDDLIDKIQKQEDHIRTIQKYVSQLESKINSGKLLNAIINLGRYKYK